MDSMGASLEAEQRAKADALRIKKKLESDINELEIALDHANKANMEGQKAIKRYQGSLRDTIQAYEDESAHASKSLRLLALLRGRLMLWVARLRNLGLSWTLLTVPRSNWTMTLPMLGMPSTRCKLSTLRLCMTRGM